jgi:nuclear GTP-binding protein
MKKKSKRIPLRLRYRIQSKVREHNRKQRREERRNPTSRPSLRKDPGIPNLHPYKEHILRQAQRAAEHRAQQRHVQLEQRRTVKVGAPSKDDGSDSDDGEESARTAHTVEHGGRGLRGDGSLRAYWKEFQKVVEKADVLLEVR